MDACYTYWESDKDAATKNQMGAQGLRYLINKVLPHTPTIFELIYLHALLSVCACLTDNVRESKGKGGGV